MGRAGEGREQGSVALEGCRGTTKELVFIFGATWWQGLEGQGRRERERQEREHQTSRADRHISGSSPPPKAWISLSFCQKLSGSLVLKTGPNPGREEREVRWVRKIEPMREGAVTSLPRWTPIPKPRSSA